MIRMNKKYDKKLIKNIWRKRKFGIQKKIDGI